MSLKDAYEQQMRARLDELRADIAKYRAKAERASADARIKYHEEIQGLEARRDVLEEKLTEIRDAGADAWETLKDGAENAWGELRQAWKEAANRFTE